MYLTKIWENYTNHREIAIIFENMFEEGSESKFGSEEGLSVFRTLCSARYLESKSWT